MGYLMKTVLIEDAKFLQLVMMAALSTTTTPFLLLVRHSVRLRELDEVDTENRAAADIWIWLLNIEIGGRCVRFGGSETRRERERKRREKLKSFPLPT